MFTELTVGRLDVITETEMLEVGKALVDNQVVVIKNQQGLQPEDLQRLCHTIGDLEGYTAKLNMMILIVRKQKKIGLIG